MRVVKVLRNPSGRPADTPEHLWRHQMDAVRARESAGLDYIVVGSAAVAAWGTAWMTRDVDIVLAKLRWRLESRSEIQWRDCVEIAAVNDLDISCMHRWAAELGVQDDLAELLDEQS